MKLTYFVRVCEVVVAAFRHKSASKNIMFRKKKKAEVYISERWRKSRGPTVRKERNQQENVKPILP